MPRRPRTVEPGVAYHVTQRGVDRQEVFFTSTDRDVYLSLMEDQLTDAGVRVLGFCLMTNHVHWVVVPESPDSLAILFRRVHGRYAQYLNAKLRRHGHLWQNRFFSCAVEPARVWSVLRYVELNPQRARLAAEPAAYPWSSAGAHLAGPVETSLGLPQDWEPWRELGGCAAWKRWLEAGSRFDEVLELRRCTYAGKPFGGPSFLAEMEATFGRLWQGPGRPRKGARPKKGTERSASAASA